MRTYQSIHGCTEVKITRGRDPHGGIITVVVKGEGGWLELVLYSDGGQPSVELVDEWPAATEG